MMLSPPVSAPDSLQDLCIFYCVEHSQSLSPQRGRATNVHFSKEGGGDAPNIPGHDLPVTLCDKLVTQFLKTHIPLHRDEHFDAVLSALLKHKNICNKLNLIRQGILSEASICDIANNHIASVNLFGCSEYSFVNPGIEQLMKQNKENIKNIRIYGIFDCLEDLDRPYYSFLADPGSPSSDGQPCITTSTLSHRGEGEIVFSIRGDFCANQRFLVTSIPKQSPENKEVTLLHSDGCYRQTSKSDEVDWFFFPNLQTFTVINTDSQSNVPSDLIIWNILASNPQLTSVCIVSVDVSFWWIKVSKLENLTTLILSSCSPRQRGPPTTFFQHLKGLVSLRHLDVSSAALCNYTDDEVEEFAEFVHTSPGLTSLELAGTNLSMILGHDQQCSNNTDFNAAHCLENCMVPLGNRRFQYLGLLNCPYNVCTHRHIPAARVSGVSGGKQILTALWSYQHNLALMSSLLEVEGVMSPPEHELSHCYPGAYIEALLAFLDQYPDWKCTAMQQPTLRVTGKVLYHLYKMMATGINRQNLVITHQRRLLERMLVLLSNCLRDIADGFPSYVDYVSRLALVNLLCLSLPEVAVYCYMLDKYISLLIIIIERRPKPMIMHLALRLIHTACRYTQDLKARIGGEFGLTKTLLTLISDSKGMEEHEVEDFDSMENVVDKSWSIMWTLTDEVPSNCERFIEHNGLEISKEVLEMNPDSNYELQRKITGSLSNIAENIKLRPFLCRQDLVVIMRNMLRVDPNGIDVSSHAAAYLILLAADGPEAWTVKEPTREEVLKGVEETIDRWQLDASRGVKFRSLNPMTLQMENKECPVAQYWACWMICNLITDKPSRYCVMFREEGGFEILDRLRIKPDLFFKVKNLVSKITEIMEENKNTVMQEDDY